MNKEEIDKIKNGGNKYLARAHLAGANLAGADLARANLARANLAGAYLAGAYLAGAYLVGANYGAFTIQKPPLQLLLKYAILIFREEGYIQAGCSLKTIKEWENITEFEDQDFLNEWKEKILAFAK